MLYFELLYVFV